MKWSPILLFSLRLAVVGGDDSEAAEDATVMLIRYRGGNQFAEGCSGVLVTPKLVLTARHCVANTEESSVCAADGTAIHGGHVADDVDPREVYVFAGNTRSAFGQPVRGAEIIDDGGTTVCNHDLALVLLERPVEGMPISPLRLYERPVEGDAVTAVGWGTTDSESEPATRQRRSDIGILAVGPVKEIGLGPDEFLTDEGPCQGDSGGPVFASSGAVIGVLSRGGNGTDDPPPEGCHGAQNVYSALTGQADLILDASHRSGYEAWTEGQPNPLLPPSPSLEAKGGCSAARSRSGGWDAMLLLLSVTICVRRARAGAPRDTHRHPRLLPPSTS